MRVCVMCIIADAEWQIVMQDADSVAGLGGCDYCMDARVYKRPLRRLRAGRGV